MSFLEMTLAAIVALIGIAAGAFGLGHSRGTAKAEQKADEQRTKEIIETEKAASARQTSVSKEASDVKDTVSRMPGSSVDNELRSDWLNKDSGD